MKLPRATPNAKNFRKPGVIRPYPQIALKSCLKGFLVPGLHKPFYFAGQLSLAFSGFCLPLLGFKNSKIVVMIYARSLLLSTDPENCVYSRRS
jgi:hypothetical protein